MSLNTAPTEKTTDSLEPRSTDEYDGPVTVEQWFATSQHLGGCYPFVIGQDSRSCSTYIGPLLDRLSVEQRRIDPVGVAEIIGRGYLLGNRTLVSAVERAPWFAQPDGIGGWQYFVPPAHQSLLRPYSALVADFRTALCNEVEKYCDGCSTIALLISGGMDSRITAGIVRDLQISERYSGDVVCVTWGVAGSRDVQYATRIAKRFNWSMHHVQLNAETLIENVFATGKLGAEFSPVHLHGMLAVRRIEGVDAFLAASYGDMVGRAEFSGTHALKLRPISFENSDRFGLIKRQLLTSSISDMRADAYAYRQHVADEAPEALRELDYHASYTRRLLAGAMSTIGMRVPLYQLFTNPETFSIMWQLDYGLRNNQVYAELLELLPGRLGDIPWARTGIEYNSATGKADKLTPVHHRYGQWLRQELRDSILELVQSDSIHNLSVFNEASLDRLLRIWPKSRSITSNAVDETVAWLASLAVFVDCNEIAGVEPARERWRDSLNSWIGPCKARAYQLARDRFRL